MMVPSESLGFSATSRRAGICILLTLSFLLLCVFYGTSVNALVFTLAVFLLLLSALLTGARHLTVVAIAQPLVGGVMGFLLLMLILNYQWTVSKDSTFAPAWSLALVPLGLLLSRVLESWRWRLYASISALVVSFALISLYFYFRTGEPPAAPLSDANNYAALLYLVFIPWSYRYLIGRWNQQTSLSTGLMTLFGLGILLMVLYASQSRAGLLIVAAALGAWLLLALIKRLPVIPVLELITVAVTAYALVYLFVPFESDFTRESLDRGMEVRLLLNDAALSIAADFPLTGSGLFTFPLLYRLIRNPLDQTTAGISPHNDYLQLLAEGGPLMVVPVLILLAATTWSLARMSFSRGSDGGYGVSPDASFGILLAIGALLAHAFINFVLFTPALALLLGIMLGMVDWQRPNEVVAGALRKWNRVTVGLMLWAWICFGYLFLDTYTLSVFGGQSGMPYAGEIRSDPEKALAYARLAESINGNRGTPILAQAMMYQLKLVDSPESEYLRDLTLHTFRRALEVDPWNPNALIAMYVFVADRDELRAQLTEEEQPERLLLRSVILDPVFTQGYDTIIDHYSRTGTPEKAYAILKSRLVPWLEWLAMVDESAAQRYLNYLNVQARSLGDSGFLPKLEALADVSTRHERHDRIFWWRLSGQ